jgi:hypothetical protein
VNAWATGEAADLQSYGDIDGQKESETRELHTLDRGLKFPCNVLHAEHRFARLSLAHVAHHWVWVGKTQF